MFCNLIAEKGSVGGNFLQQMYCCAILRQGLRLHTLTEQLEATADVDLPPSTWADILSAADQLTRHVFPAERVGLLLTGDQRIRALNELWRGNNSATDVLSWPSADHASGYAGEIAVSWDAVRRQAATHGHCELTEAMALIAHGLLHLAGHDHPTPEAQAEMDTRMHQLLRLIEIEVKSFGH